MQLAWLNISDLGNFDDLRGGFRPHRYAGDDDPVAAASFGPVECLIR
jgi:hypothetical protein